MSTLPAHYRYSPLIIFIAVAVVNFWPTDQRRFEDDADTLVTAADYAFSIWGVIFLGMIGLSVVLAKAAEPDTPALRRAIMGLLVAGLASIAFVPISISGNVLLSFIDVLVHLFALIYAYGALRQHVQTVPGLPLKQRLWFYGPSMYLGWISAATVISASLAFESIGFVVDYQIALILALILVFVLFNIGSRFLREADAVYTLTVAWALVGIGVEQWAEPVLPFACLTGAGLLILLIGWRFSTGGSIFYASPGYYKDREPRLPSL